MLRPFADGGGPRYRVIDEARIIDVLLSGGWLYEFYGDAARAQGDARAALRHWLALGLPFETGPGGGRLFDSAEVLNFISWTGLYLADPLWEHQFIATGRRLALDMHPAATADSGPPPVSALRPIRFCVTLEREYDLRSCPSRARVRLRLPLPVEDAALTDLELTILPPTVARGVEYSRAVGRLDAILRDPVEDRVTLGVRASFAAHPWPSGDAGRNLAEADIYLYTRQAEGLVQVTPRIRMLSQRLSVTSDDPAVLVERFWRFVIETLICGVIRYDQVPATEPLDWVLDRGWCDCQLGSALLVALCRARGIPARISSGYLLYPMAPRYHYWVEVWLPPRGWLPFDLLGWGLSLGGRDAVWRDYFYAGLDYRCRTQCLPRLFTGVSPVRLPAVWQLLTRPLVNGVEAGIWSHSTGDFVFVDRVWVHEPSLDHRQPGPPSLNAGPLLP